MANDIQNSFLDHRYCNWAFISFPSLAIAPFCIILKTESIFLLLAMAMAMAIATITAIYSKTTAHFGFDFSPLFHIHSYSFMHRNAFVRKYIYY